jgi:hypothetical protein
MMGDIVGLHADADAPVALAEEALATAPSLGSQATLGHALFARAAHRVAQARPDFASLQERFRRSSSADQLIAAAISVDGPLRDALLQDADVRRAIELIRTSYAASPASVASGRAWILLRGRDPQAADAMAQTYLGDESDRLQEEISARLTPFSPSTALAAYWRARMGGNDEGALAILEAARSRAVPIPIEAP